MKQLHIGIRGEKSLIQNLKNQVSANDRHQPQLFIDIEGADIPYRENALQINPEEKIKRSHSPFSEMKTGKFRKLFDRHILAYKH